MSRLLSSIRLRTSRFVQASEQMEHMPVAICVGLSSLLCGPGIGKEGWLFLLKSEPKSRHYTGFFYTKIKCCFLDAKWIYQQFTWVWMRQSVWWMNMSSILNDIYVKWWFYFNSHALRYLRYSFGFHHAKSTYFRSGVKFISSRKTTSFPSFLCIFMEFIVAAKVSFNMKCLPATKVSAISFTWMEGHGFSATTNGVIGRIFFYDDVIIAAKVCQRRIRLIPTTPGIWNIVYVVHNTWK